MKKRSRSRRRSRVGVSKALITRISSTLAKKIMKATPAASKAGRTRRRRRTSQKKRRRRRRRS